MKENVPGIQAEKLAQGIRTNLAQLQAVERLETWSEAVSIFLRLGSALLVSATRLKHSTLDDMLSQLAVIEVLLKGSVEYATSVKQHLKDLMTLPKV